MGVAELKFPTCPGTMNSLLLLKFLLTCHDFVAAGLVLVLALVDTKGLLYDSHNAWAIG